LESFTPKQAAFYLVEKQGWKGVKGRTEVWKGKQIRFVEKDGEWQAVGKDIAEALGYEHPENAVTQHCKHPCTLKRGIGVATGTKRDGTPAIQKVDAVIIAEKDIYRLIFRSRLPEAEAFQDWVYDILKELRKSLGLSEYEVFRLMDKEQQKEAMRKLNESLREPAKVDYIKANTIADKAVSTMHGYLKMVKKPDMDERMLREREPILVDTVALMALNERFELGLSVSEHIYRKYTEAAV
jgi:prophage antirepressor-like protein